MTRERVVYELENSIKLGISISREACEWLLDYLEQEPILDKIRAEIDQYLEIEGFGSEYRNDVKGIIDKYKADKEQE